MAEQLASYDPSNGKLLGEVQVTSIEEINEKVVQAHAAALHWKRLRADERVNVLQKAYENAGQMCTATERIYVDERIVDQFEKRVVELATRYKVGPWDMPGGNIGPIINADQHDKIIKHIRNAVEKGARVLLGGVEQLERYVKPTVISDMSPDMVMEQEETFGPVVAISRFSDIDEAIRRANNSTYGLGAVVFGGKEAETVADQLEAGMVGINQGVGGAGDAPWVGAKQSGYGFHGSPEGHRQFAQIRVINR